MYATCLHCHRSLGRNTEIEAFPVGARLAFDGARGRLWVICPACARWNLSPLEERWEAVEWCERAYRETASRAATGEIGLARRRSGLQLIRVGKPLRPEFASWRYGRQLHRRYRSAWLTRAHDRVSDAVGDVPEARAAFVTELPVLAIIGAVAIAIMEAPRMLRQGKAVRGVIHRGVELPLLVRDLSSMRLLPAGSREPALLLTDSRGTSHVIREDVMPLLGRLLSRVNHTGGSEHQVTQAVAKIEHFGPNGLLSFLVARNEKSGRPLVEALGYEQRLALEMISHEETERRAMEGELQLLADAWRDAEEIAAIADDLLVPSGLRAALTRAARGRAPG